MRILATFYFAIAGSIVASRFGASAIGVSAGPTQANAAPARATASPLLDPKCDPPGSAYGDAVAVANDGTILVGSLDCGEIWRFPPGAHGDVAPAGVLTGWKNLDASIQAIGTSGSHLLVAGFSSLGVFDENATGNDGPLRFLGDGEDDTESATGLQNPVGGPVRLGADGDGRLFVLENRAVHGSDGGFTVVQFAPGTRGNVAPVREFDPTAEAEPPAPIPAMEPGDNPDAAREGTKDIAVDASGRLYALDWYGNILLSGPRAAMPMRPIAKFGKVAATLLALDGRGRLIAAGGDAIAIITGVTSGSPRESVIRGSRTTLLSRNAPDAGIEDLGTDAAGSIYVLTCPKRHGRLLRFAPDAIGNVAPASVLAGPLTHLRC